MTAPQMITDDLDMKTRIERVLDETKNTENRAAKMDVDDILKSVYHKHPCCSFLTMSLL